MESQSNPMTYGQYLRRRRLEMGWTQLILTMKSGVGQSELSKYETDKSLPELPAIIKIARAFGENPPLLEMADGRSTE